MYTGRLFLNEVGAERLIDSCQGCDRSQRGT